MNAAEIEWGDELGECGGDDFKPYYDKLSCVFFFQAEDGIRDLTVTGVQTCALPIYALPSPPHMMLNAVATSGDGTATVSWQPARTCHLPLTGYQAVAQPGNLIQNLAPSATSAVFAGLQNGVTYTITVTAINSDGQDSLQSNPIVPGKACTAASLDATPTS